MGFKKKNLLKNGAYRRLIIRKFLIIASLNDSWFRFTNLTSKLQDKIEIITSALTKIIICKK